MIGSRLRRSLAAAALTVAGAGTWACAPRGGEASAGELAGKLVLTGSSTVAPLAAEIGKRFEQRYPGTRVEVQTGGSSRGIADTRNGIADFGMASRALADSERDLEAYTIARDGIAVIVHASNPAAELDREQLAAIYRGSITNWSTLGGASEPVTVVTKASGRATLDVFLSYLGMTEPEIEAEVVIGDNQQGIKTVAAVPGAIGYVSIGVSEAAIAAGEPIRMLATGPVSPTAANVAAGSFPITRPLNLLHRNDDPLSPLELAFLDFATSGEVDDLVTSLGFVPPMPPATLVPL